MALPAKSWNPQHLERVAESYDTSMGTTEVETDAGKAYIKPMGNRQGPHALACEWVATHLADWFGLPTFEINLLVLGPSDLFPLPRNARASAGPAFASRAMPGHSWGRSAAELDTIVNPDDITRLIAFDTWTLNCDRHPPDVSVRKPNYDNVYLADVANEPNRLRLIAMDHTHCFTCGRDLVGNVATVDRIKDNRTYGLFPEFESRLRPEVVSLCADKLRRIDTELVDDIIGSIPHEWEVATEARISLKGLILHRAAFVADQLNAALLRPSPSRAVESTPEEPNEGD